jgi:hypothetical protein
LAKAGSRPEKPQKKGIGLFLKDFSYESEAFQKMHKNSNA